MLEEYRVGNLRPDEVESQKLTMKVRDSLLYIPYCTVSPHRTILLAYHGVTVLFQHRYGIQSRILTFRLLCSLL
jgi:hypothetical protein